MRISAEQVPSFHRVAPRSLKQVTSSNFWPFMLILPLTLFVLLVMILFFLNGFKTPTNELTILFLSVLISHSMITPLICLQVCW